MTQRMIQFETSTDEGVARVREALARAFDALAAERPTGVGLAYWQVQGSRRFLAPIDLPDERANPLLQVAAARALPGIIDACVPGGYPGPAVIEAVGAYDPVRHLPESTSGQHGS